MTDSTDAANEPPRSSGRVRPRGVGLLIVEDEASIAKGLAFNFEREGYDVTVAADGPAALLQFEPGQQQPACVVLDLMLPGMSGYAICEAIRQRDTAVPILVLSARTLSEDKARAFDAGCDQYMTKPFTLDELLSRVRNLIARRVERPVAVATEVDVQPVGAATVDFRRHQLQPADGGESVALTKMEVALLRYFLANEGDVLSRAAIGRDVWDQTSEVNSRSIDNFVLRLRRLIEPDPSTPRHLLSVRGTGYRFVRDSDS